MLGCQSERTDSRGILREPRFPHWDTFSACSRCPQFSMKRQAVGIWGCKACGKVQAGGAYTLK